MTAKREAFVGTWKLVSFESQAGGETTRPFGENPVGQIIYTPGGYMSAVLEHEEREPFDTDDVYGSPEETVRAFQTSVSYAGPYRIEGNRVYHTARAASIPGWSGQDQERIYEFDGDRLTLSTPPILAGGEEQTMTLVWERVE